MQTPDNPYTSAPTQPRQRGWFARNWFWVVPVLVLIPLLMCGGFIGGIFALVGGVLKSAEPYKTAIERAANSPAVIAKLGEPIEDDTWIPMGNVNFDNYGGDANLTLQVRGPHGAASVHTVALREAGVWETETLTVTFADGTRLDLLE